MSLDDFQLIDNEKIDNSIIKKDFLKIYHQQAANLNDFDQNIDFIFGEKKIIIKSVMLIFITKHQYQKMLLLQLTEF